MGRAEIVLEYITNRNKRMITEKKREFGFIRKGVKLNGTTGNVFLFSQTEDGVISIFTSKRDVKTHVGEIYQKLTSEDSELRVKIYGPNNRNAIVNFETGREFGLMRKGAQLNTLAGTNIFAFTESGDGTIRIFTSKSVSLHLQEILLYQRMALGNPEIYIQIYGPDTAEKFKNRKIIYRHPDMTRKINRIKRPEVEMPSIDEGRNTFH